MYMIYGKEKGKKRLKPVNLTDGCFENNVIHGSFFDKEDEAQRVVDDLNKCNADMEFTYKKKS